MAPKKLFLCHYSGDAAEVRELATELRLHGVVPWVDKQGGFEIADDCEPKARQAIGRDCFGVLVYATNPVFERPFIRNVEVDEAVKVRARDPSFALFAVPQGIDFRELQRLSKRHFGVDLSQFHTRGIGEGENTCAAYREIAEMVLARIIGDYRGPEGMFSLQYSTREVMPHLADDVLCIDATDLFSETVYNPQKWDQLVHSLAVVKRVLSETLGRPRLRVHGSKHLTAAFVFGRVFAPFEMDIRQTPNDVWCTDCVSGRVSPFVAAVKSLPNSNRRLFLEIAARNKDVARGVDDWLARGGAEPSVRLQLTPHDPTLSLDNSMCRAAANQTYDALERVLREHCATEIHLFAAAPQSFMAMLGRKFRGLPPVYLYEWTGERYGFACRLPSGVL
jgi:hypothetical protein